MRKQHGSYAVVNSIFKCKLELCIYISSFYLAGSRGAELKEVKTVHFVIAHKVMGVFQN